MAQTFQYTAMVKHKNDEILDMESSVLHNLQGIKMRNAQPVI